ncbi:galactose-specific C-type lectin [Culex quinquefasciatus]|uniref:Galactose-specific C-type lectin n=1 Tax=Culex quinquefasciatus TaxID=7176 RepID=B0WYS8_CULQU|nr:galactose-specific C-type lectin [Culex quinquefasciatus]|eukprot:XP_001862550.1 galactose-specific C-type lectin [Culex quinquefasciatus]
MRGAVFLGVLALSVAVSTGFCPKAECEDKAEFVIPNFKANWFKAMEYCHYLGLKLTRVRSADDQLRIEVAINGTDKGTDTEFWTGGNDLGDQRNFHWYSTGGRITWFNWFDVESSYNQRRNYVDQASGNCIYLGYQNSDDLWKWGLGSYQDARYFICERNLS